MDESDPALIIDLPADADAVALARRFVSANSDSLPADLVSDAELLVSELVSNAVRHGRPVISLRVELDPPLLGVRVQDHGATVPTLPSQRPDDSAPSGRGLIIVDRLSHEWGVTLNDPPPGKTVWFRLVADQE